MNHKNKGGQRGKVEDHNSSRSEGETMQQVMNFERSNNSLATPAGGEEGQTWKMRVG